jgi:ribosomal protein S8
MNFLNSYSNCLSQIKNAVKHRWSYVDIKANTFVINLLHAFYLYNLIDGFYFSSTKKINKNCRIYIKYFQGYSLIINIKTYHLPGNFYFLTKHKIKKLMYKDTKSIFFISTSQGIKAYTFENMKISPITGGLLLCCVRTL